jgi:uncharacterized membrane protein
MSWLQRYRLRNFVRISPWIVPVGAALVAAPAVGLVRAIDEATHWQLLGFGPEGARALATALTASTLTFVVFLYSALLVAIQVASAQLSPRIIARALGNRPMRACVGLFVFTFVFGVVVLGRIETSVGQLRLLILAALSLLSIATFLYVVQYLAKLLRPISVLEAVGRDCAVVLEKIYPRRLGGPAEPTPAARDERDGAPPSVVTHEGASGVLLAFDVAGLVRRAGRAGCRIEMLPQVGDFVAKGDRLFHVHGARGDLDPGGLRESVAFGAERTMEQDPAFAFRIIVDVAIKALSPAINDPTTAVLAIDQLDHLLRQVGHRRLDSRIVRDAGGHVRLSYNTPNWDDFLRLAVTEIRHCGGSSIQVTRRLRAMLQRLIATLPSERVAAVEEELHLLERTVGRSFPDPEDQARAGSADSQGLAGHH